MYVVNYHLPVSFTLSPWQPSFCFVLHFNFLRFHMEVSLCGIYLSVSYWRQPTVHIHTFGPMLWQSGRIYLRLNGISLCVSIIFSLFICWQKCGYFHISFLWIMFTWIWMCRCIFEIVILFPLDIYPVVGMLYHLLVPF